MESAESSNVVEDHVASNLKVDEQATQESSMKQAATAGLTLKHGHLFVCFFTEKCHYSITKIIACELL
jgi:hypothetical protein